MALSYPIIFKNSFCDLTAELQKITQGHRRICIVSDSHVAPLYLDAVQEAVSSCCADPGVFVFEAGEEQKNLNTVQDLYRYLIRSHIQRNDLLLALGGGVTGDLTAEDRQDAAQHLAALVEVGHRLKKRRDERLSLMGQVFVVRGRLF